MSAEPVPATQEAGRQRPSQTAPPLTDEQAERIRRILRGARTARTAADT